jgi:acetylserotonin N-methyltransferase
MTDPAIVLDLIDAFRRSKCMFTTASLGIFDQTPGTLDELAAKLNANPDALERLLCGCVSLGLLQQENGTFRNSATAEEYLKRSSHQTLVGYVNYSNHVLYPMWANLEDAVKEGTHRWKQTFGTDGALFSHFFRTPEAKYEFMLAMHGFGVMSSPRVVESFDLNSFRRLVDLGGGTGHLPMAAVARYPEMQVAVFDLAPVIEVTKQFVDDRVELITGDFFTDPLPPADLYSMGRIVHDWTVEKIDRLLAKIYDALPSGGGLLIVERLLAPDKSGPASALMQSLNMLVCTEGKERTVAEYEELLKRAGFSAIEGRLTGALEGAILARK